MRRKINISIVLLAILIVSCSTKKNTILTRAYHNVTSKYNIYFNGYESYKKGMQKIKKLPDDYTGILPLYQGGTTDAASAVQSEMDRAIRKSDKVINLHSLTVKPNINKNTTNPRKKKLLAIKQYNKWVDDAYILKGKSNYQKLEIFKGNDAFRYILKEYPGTESSIEANIWLAKSLLKTSEFTEAEEILKSLAAQPDFPKKHLAFFNAVYAEYYILRKRYAEAIPKLEMAVEKVKERKLKMRFLFVLAQLYQIENISDKATNSYLKVIKMSPPYEMTFNAKVNLAGVFRSDYGDANEIRKSLYKLMKDDKNKEYLDQIYYALANIDYKEGEIDKAVENYKLSAIKSITNTKQKAKSFIAIADIYYAKRNYLPSSAYYDSAMLLVDVAYPDYESISSRAANLGKLQENLKIVSFQDSVLFIAQMSKEDRTKFIDKLIERVKAEEAEAQRLDQERLLDLQFNVQNSTQSNNAMEQAQGLQWYFYSPTAKSFGQNDFKKRWGNRKLEDNWRRSIKKGNLSDMNNKTDGTEDKENVKAKLSNKTQEFYLVDLPMSDSAKAKSQDQIKSALYNAGSIYNDYLNEPLLSAQQYQSIVERYPNDEISADALFQLYKIYIQLKNEGKAMEQKALIIKNNPSSVYASILSNPEFLKELQEKENRAELLYQGAYDNYIKGNYALVIEKADEAISTFPNHVLLPKFEFVKTVAAGKLVNDDKLRANLYDYVKKFPYGDEAKFAKEIMGKLDIQNPEVKQFQEQQIARTIYNKPNDDDLHLFIITINPLEAKANQAVFNLINFNLDNFSNAGLGVNTEKLSDKATMVIVKMFKKKQEAINYFDASMARKDEIYKDVGIGITGTFIINADNFNILKKEGKEIDYLNFFKDQYKK